MAIWNMPPSFHHKPGVAIFPVISYCRHNLWWSGLIYLLWAKGDLCPNSHFFLCGNKAVQIFRDPNTGLVSFWHIRFQDHALVNINVRQLYGFYLSIELWIENVPYVLVKGVWLFSTDEWREARQRFYHVTRIGSVHVPALEGINNCVRLLVSICPQKEIGWCY